MGRAPCCDKASVKKGPWSSEEDSKLKSYIEAHGTGGNWITLPQKIGLKRCGKSCRLRWLNYLRPNIKHGGFSEEEDNIICTLYIAIGSRWSIIAAQLPGRTDNDIKNYWNTRLKKKLLGKQRKDQRSQPRARMQCSLQEDNKDAEARSSTLVANNGNCPNTRCPQPVVPVNPASQVDQNVFDGFLIKLGGRFGQDQDHQLDAPSLVNAMPASADTSQGSSLLGSHLFPAELGEMFYCNPVRLEGLDGIRAAANDGWSEVGPSIFAPVAEHDAFIMH